MTSRLDAADSRQTLGSGLALPETALLDALRTALLVIAPDWQVVYANPAGAQVLKRERESVLGRTLWSLVPGLEQGAAGEVLRATMDDGASRHLRFELPGASGGLSADVSRDAAGRLLCELRDEAAVLLEAQTDLFEELGEETESLRALARQMSEIADTQELLALLCLTATRHSVAGGAVVLELRGEDVEVVAGTGIMQAATGIRFPLAGSFVEDPVQRRETRAVERFTGTARPFAKALSQVTKIPKVGPALLAPLIAYEQVVGVLGVYRESGAPPFGPLETERLRVIAAHASLVVSKSLLLAQAQEADRAKGRFLATMSHELRTPLTALAGYGELLADEILGPLTEEQADVLARMQSVTHHLSAMIEEILAFSSLEAGREVVRPVECLASDLAHAALAVVGPLASDKGLALELELADPSIRLVTDIDKLRQVLVNLLGNAVKFTDRGRVRLVVTRGDDEVRLRVEDSGIGIAPTDLPRLFQPFQQLDTGLTRRHGGTGLGLYISQRLMSLLGGRIEVESVVGEGAVFTVVVPG